MPLGNTFELARLTIEAYQDGSRGEDKKHLVDGSHTLEVMFNPETLSTHHGHTYEQNAKDPASSSTAQFAYSASPVLDVKLVIDGTGAAYLPDDPRPRPTVAATVARFLKLCYAIDSDSHEAAYLKLKWGNGIFGPSGFVCRLQSVDIQYDLFDRSGAPLRASLTAKFIEDIDPEQRAKELRLSSPDLTHRRVVRSGDTLAGLCREIYGSEVHHLRVARVNDLDDPRGLTPGQELIFPPYTRGARG